MVLDLACVPATLYSFLAIFFLLVFLDSHFLGWNSFQWASMLPWQWCASCLHSSAPMSLSFLWMLVCNPCLVKSQWPLQYLLSWAKTNSTILYSGWQGGIYSSSCPFEAKYSCILVCLLLYSTLAAILALNSLTMPEDPTECSSAQFTNSSFFLPVSTQSCSFA